MGPNFWNIFSKILIFAFFTSSSILARAESDDPGGILDSIFRSYDKRFRPNHGRESLEVGVTIYVLGINKFDLSDMTITLDMYFRQTWTDPRLVFDGNEKILLDNQFANKLWIPDTFFVNEVTSKLHDIPTPNTFTRLHSSGSILKSSRFTIQMKCPLNLANFPFDDQICSLEIESFGCNMNDIHYKWAKGHNSFGISSNVSVPEYRVVGHRLQTVEISLTSGNYSRLAADILISRSHRYYVLEYFLPATILTCLTFLCLLIPDNKSAVILNGLLVGLILLFLNWSVGRMELPKISYIKSIDVFSIFTLVFSLSSLLLNILQLYLSQRTPGPSNLAILNDGETAELPSKQTKLQQLNRTRLDLERNFFKFFWMIKLLLVVLYVLFFLIYWLVNGGSRQNTDELISEGVILV